MKPSRLEEILSYNKKFVKDKEYEQYETTKNPDKKMVILSCMDTRLTELLPKAMNIKNGDAKIIKNAGATIMHPFGSIIRSLIVAVYEFEAKDVIVVGHYGCGMSNLDTNSLINKMLARGISKETLSTVYNCGVEIDKWLHGFDSVEDSIRESVNSIKSHPLMPKDVNVYGLIIDPYTGKLEPISK
ncbi:beta-class carbonic anhydrase [[Clostridium] dakarense]|uniref:beta-class carbonic anhydrase n=1 Tax=Faecalimicrobium dakarense TaxID=1301100 RepID=UPI0004BB701A|nr:carbonic anhydrase [[Clostridium] dakarense]